MFRGFSEPNIKPSRYPCGWERQRGPGKEKKLPWGIWQSIWFNCRSVTLGELTVPDSEVGDCEDHGVPGEDVVATEILLLSKADPPSHSHLHHLGQDCWAGERGLKKVFFCFPSYFFTTKCNFWPVMSKAPTCFGHCQLGSGLGRTVN